MRGVDLVLLVANVVYGTSYVVTRVVLDWVPPATLALVRLVLGAGVLAVWVGRLGPAGQLSRHDRVRIAAMGVVGVGGAFVLSHWGLERSTATNAALLITVEPITLLLLGPLLLGERLAPRERVGAALALAGAAIVVVNGVPGITRTLAPHWRGDVLLVLSGIAFASYSLLGRGVLRRHRALPVTAASIVWGIPALVPLVLAEWMGGRFPVWTAGSVAGTLYLAVVVTALGYLVWNLALERVSAARAGIFINAQPVVGALLGVVLLGEPLTVFTTVGGALVVIGLAITAKRV